MSNPSWARARLDPDVEEFLKKMFQPSPTSEFLVWDSGVNDLVRVHELSPKGRRDALRRLEGTEDDE